MQLMHSHSLLLRKMRLETLKLALTLNKISVTVSAMDHTNLRDNSYTSHPIMHFQETYQLRPNMKLDESPFGGVPNSSQGFLQDFNYQVDDNYNHNQFHLNGSSSSNPASALGIHTLSFESFDNFDVYECKPNFVDEINNNVHDHAQVVLDDFQYEADANYCSLNNMPHQRNHQVNDMTQTYVANFNNSQEIIKPVNFVLPDDELSCIAPSMNYYRKFGFNKKNNRRTTSSYRLRKKSNAVKGQWSIEEDRYIYSIH